MGTRMNDLNSGKTMPADLNRRDIWIYPDIYGMDLECKMEMSCHL